MARKRTSPEYLWEAWVTPQDNVGGFLVQSESDPNVSYIVDLMAYNGAGHCTCDDYATRVGCYRAKEIEPVHKNCKHVRKCFEFVGEELMRKLADMARRGEVIIEPDKFKKVPPSQEKERKRR